MTSRFVLDANLSPLTSDYLVQTFGLDVVSLIAEGLGHLEDPDVVAYARRSARIIITLDLDFGEIYHRREHGTLGVIILRLQDQTIESVNAVLDRFFRADWSGIDLTRSLVVVDERRVRVTTEPPSE